MQSAQKHGLTLCRGLLASASARAARDRLLTDVLALDVEATEDPWTSFALFEPLGRCVGNVDAAVLPLFLDGWRTEASGIRSVAVAVDWRGRGLFRDLMLATIAWCETQSAAPTFLYTEEPVLYERFGFLPMPQHAFVGTAPAPVPGPPARRLDPGDAAQRALILDLVGRRSPVSAQCALEIDAAQFIANLAKDDSLSCAYIDDSAALIVYEENDDEIIVADIVAAVIPDLATILGALALRPTRAKILFPPDKLGWTGEPTFEDTGLMIRGETPAALTRPFMFSPMAGF